MSPPTPKLPKVPAMADPQSPQILEAQKQAQAAIYSRTGRRSTILSS